MEVQGELEGSKGHREEDVDAEVEEDEAAALSDEVQVGFPKLATPAGKRLAGIAFTGISLVASGRCGPVVAATSAPLLQDW